MWDLIVSVPDHCLSFYFSLIVLKQLADVFAWNEDVHVVLVLSFDISFLYLFSFQLLICLSPQIAL